MSEGAKKAKSNGHSATKHSNQAQFKPNVMQMAERAKESGKSNNQEGEQVQLKKNVLGEPAFFQPNVSVQARLKMGSSGDKFEKEADSVADQVVQKSEAKNVESAPASPPVQLTKVQPNDLQKKEEESKDSDEGMNDDLLQSKETIQMKSSLSGDDASGIESDLQSSKGGGSKLDDGTRSQMESGIGADFSGVRVHTDSKAEKMNQQIGAKAFTNRSDVYFNNGEYNPSSKEGQHLLAHELTHTVQQGASGDKVQAQMYDMGQGQGSSIMGAPRLTRRHKTWLKTYFNVSESDLQNILKDPDPRPVGYDHYPRENAEGYLATMIDIIIKQNGGEQFPPLATPGYETEEDSRYVTGRAKGTSSDSSVGAPALSGPYNWSSGGQYNVRYWEKSNDRTLSKRKGNYGKNIIPERRGQAPGGIYDYEVTSQLPNRSYGGTIKLDIVAGITNDPNGESSTVNSQINFAYPGGKFYFSGNHQYKSEPLPDPYQQPGNDPGQKKKKKTNWWWDETGDTGDGTTKKKNKHKNSKGGSGGSSGGIILKLPDWLMEMLAPYPDQASYEQMSQEEREELAEERFWQEFSLGDVGAKILVGLVIGLGIFGAIALAFSGPVALIVGGIAAILFAGINLLMDSDITIPDWIKSGLMVLGGALLILAAIFEAPAFIIGAIIVGVGYGLFQIFNAFSSVKDAAKADSVEDFKKGIEDAAEEAETGFADTILSLIPVLKKFMPKKSWFKPRSPGSRKDGGVMDKIKKILSGKKNNKGEKNKNQNTNKQNQSSATPKAFDFEIANATPDQLAALNHAFNRHGAELSKLIGKPIHWTKKPNLQSMLDNFNEAVSLIRNSGTKTGQAKVPFGVKGSGSGSSSTVADVFILESGGNSYYLYIRASDGKFISAGLNTKTINYLP